MAANEVVGYGNVDKRNAFSCKVSQALSSLVKYRCWDNDETFPTVDDLETTANDVLAGTSGNGNKSMVCLVDTTNAAPGANWKPASPTAGEANPNRMKGDTNYVEQDGTILDADGRCTWNMVIEVPSDATTSMAMGFDLELLYTYTGSVPTLTWAINTGTEVTPTWTTVTPGTDGVLHCRDGSGPTGGGGDGHYYANIPTSGVEDTVEGWVDQDTNPEA